MTREEILAMEPGRELDVIIAHKVMGWVVTSCETNPHTQTVTVKSLREPDDQHFGVSYEETMKLEYAAWLRVDVPNYSTDISAAWEVVEKMCDTHWFTVANGMSKGSARCAFGRYGIFESPAVFSDSVPESICKAALLAVMDGETT